MNLARTAGATTAPALLTSCDDPDALDAFVRGLRLSIRQPAQVLVARRPQASGHPAPPPSLDASFPVKLVETPDNCEPAAIWIELAKRTLADKLIYLDPEYLASPSLVGAFEHALEPVIYEIPGRPRAFQLPRAGRTCAFGPWQRGPG